MAQIKGLKLDATTGFPKEYESTDDITLNSFTASLAGGLNVTSGVSLTNNITFNAVTDTIAGIENQNLLDKEANETIGAGGAVTWAIATGSDLTIADSPTADIDAANKAYVDAVAQGLDWQDSVLDIQTDASLDPGGTPTEGDRYIITDSGNLHANFGTITGVGDDDIVEYDGSNFVVVGDASDLGEGMAAWDESSNTAYIFNGTDWVKMAGIYNHNDLAGLDTGDYQHLTGTEHTWLTTVIADIDAANVADLSDDEIITGDWSLSAAGSFDASLGELTFPNAESSTPAEGDAYWDGTADELKVYDGASWVAVGGGVDETIYTADEALSARDVLYISAADNVSKADATAFSTAKVIGLADADTADTNSVSVITDGLVSGFSGLTAGAPYFLQTTAGTIATTRPSGAGNVVYMIGYAKSATELQLQLQFIGIRS